MRLMEQRAGICSAERYDSEVLRGAVPRRAGKVVKWSGDLRSHVKIVAAGADYVLAVKGNDLKRHTRVQSALEADEQVSSHFLGVHAKAPR